jgi:hypothetical protein
MGAEGDRGVLRAPDHLVDVHVVEKGEAAAADLLGVAEGPEVLLLGLLHELAEDLAAAGVQVVLDRVDALLDEVAHLLADGLDVVRDGKRERRHFRISLLADVRKSTSGECALAEPTPADERGRRRWHSRSCISSW